MSQQIQITGGAKVRNLEGVLTGTSGVVNALGINVPSGIPQLDGSGKILVSQLPNSVMEYKGTWNAATNTPTLADGTGNQGDVYLCNVAGTANFGSGPIAFFVGDQVIYSGTIWQRASGATGTVTSVAVTESGDSLNVTGSPITTSGTINIGFNGNSGQYINGQGNLTTFPSLAGYVTSVTATAPLVSSGGTTPDLSIPAASASVDGYLDNADWTTFNNKQNAITLTTTGTSGVSTLIGSTLNIPNYSTDLSGYVPYTGATANVNLGTFDLTADVITGATGSFASSGGSNTFTINHSSGSGISLNITKGGNGEGLYINKTSGSGNAATIIGTLNATTLVKSGGTSSQFLKADGSVDASAYITLGSLSAGAGISYNNTTGVIASTITQYTDALARAAISLTTTGTSGASTYNNTTGVLNVPTYTLAGLGGVPTTRNITINGLTQDLSADRTWTITAGISSVSGTAPISVATVSGAATVSIATANTTTTGALTSTDWNTFNGKQNALTNPVTGTGTLNYVPKFTATGSTIGNSQIFDNGTSVIIGGTAAVTKLQVLDSGNSYSAHFSGNNLSNGIAIGTLTGNRAVIQGYTRTFSGYCDIAIQPDSGNLGIGVTPSPWNLGKTLQIGGTYGTINFSGTSGILGIVNAYWDGTSYIRQNTGSVFNLEYNIGIANALNFRMQGTGDAGTTAVLAPVMTLFNTGNLFIGSGATDAGYRLDVSGTARFSANSRTLLVNTSTRVLDVIGTDNFYGVSIAGSSTTSQSYGLVIYAGTNTSDRSLLVQNKAANTDYLLVRGDGQVVIGPGTASGSRFAVSAPVSHFSFGNNEGATFNIQPASLGQNGVNLNASYWTGTGFPFVNFVLGGENVFRINPDKQIFLYAQDNVTAKANIYYELGVNQYRIYSTNASGSNAGIKIAQYNGTTYENVVTEARTLSINGVTYDLSANRSWTVGGGGTAAWGSLTGGVRNGYDLQIRPATNSGNYGGFEFQNFGGTTAGFLLVSSPDTGGVYTANGLTIVADLGWLSLAQRTQSDKGVRIMSGPTPSVRLEVSSAGHSRFLITQGGAGSSDRVSISDSANNIDFVSYAAGSEPYSNTMGMYLSGGKDMLLMANTSNIRFVTGSFTERMRLWNNGNLALGNPTVDNGYRLQINGSASFAFGFLSVYRGSSGANDILVGNDGNRFYIGGNTYVAGTITTTSNISVTGSVTATGGFFDTSDSRLKIIVKDYEQPKGIENVAARMYVKNSRKELGYFAQDLQEILPSAVIKGEDGFLTLSYSQVHTAKIAYLEKEVAELKELIKSLVK